MDQLMIEEPMHGGFGFAPATFRMEDMPLGDTQAPSLQPHAGSQGGTIAADAHGLLVIDRDSGKLLRTHTSSVQIRTMETAKPPVRIIAPGSAYRRDEIDATHLSVFNQLEGLYVAEDVSLPDLKGTLEYFLVELFGPETEVRFRPHFFPFTEPSFEIDVKLTVKGQEPRWIEVAGCGMVDPAVFEAIDGQRKDDAFAPEKVTGFAFGMGLDRLAMIRWGIKDIRLLIENDVRFLSQFS